MATRRAILVSEEDQATGSILTLQLTYFSGFWSWHVSRGAQPQAIPLSLYEPKIWNVRRGKRWEKEDLLNARLALEPSHILHDLIDILEGNALDLRHVPKFPMVRLDAVGRRPLEGRIPVMIRLVDLMH